MVFSSVIFLFFFLPLTLLSYYVVPRSFRNLVLLLASLVFYAWGEGLFLFIMLFSILFNYVFGLLIEKFKGVGLSKVFLVFAIFLNLSLLSIYKYINFIVDNINTVLPLFNVQMINLSPVHLPVGISFFTFQAMSYIIDVYRREVPAQKNPLDVGLYISLFPQLIAGPIIRYHDVAKQIVHRTLTSKKFAEGIERFVFGLGKKVLIANPMGSIADQIFALTSEGISPGVAWLGVLCYSFQIYFDFSGYSDMAIGLGRMFGFRFLENFNYPYISKSMQEFWRRWHISLSNWFRDYLYIPLGGNRCKPIRVYVNLLTVFFLCGLWHGASWNFVIWGLMHGFFLTIERVGFIRILEGVLAPFRHIYVIIIVMISWVFFRSETLTEAYFYLQFMFNLASGFEPKHTIAFFLDKHGQFALMAALLCSTPILPFVINIKEKMFVKLRPRDQFVLNGFGATFNTLTMVLILYASVISLAAGVYNPFIYFRF